MRMSVPAYICLGLAAILVLTTFAVHPDVRFLVTTLPMLLVLAVVPVLLSEMNKRHAAKVDIRALKLYKIKDVLMFGAGTPIRIRGYVEAASLKWLNRPHFRINDGSGVIGAIMFAAPREDIKPGDKVEVAGSLRRFGLSKDRKIWGVKMIKINR